MKLFIYNIKACKIHQISFLFYDGLNIESLISDHIEICFLEPTQQKN